MRACSFKFLLAMCHEVWFLNKSLFSDNRVHLPVDPELESTSQKIEDVCKSSKPLTLKSGRETNSVVERCTPRTKIRPASLPVDRLLLLASPSHERNGRNLGNVNSDKFFKSPTFEGFNRKDTPVCCKFDGFDQQTVQKIPEKQYGQNDLTAKTTTIMPSALQEGGVMTGIKIGGDQLLSAIQPSKPNTEPARQVSQRRSSDSCSAAPVRAPRTLQPQPWTTFYKPRVPAGSMRGVEEKPAPSLAVPTVTDHASQGHVLKSIPDSENAPICPMQPVSSKKPKENSEERDLPGVHPTCQRPRLKRMQQFEDLEDEVPQFV